MSGALHGFGASVNGDQYSTSISNDASSASVTLLPRTTNVQIYDATGKTLTITGTTSSSTLNAKYGSSSIFFPGSGNGNIITNNSNIYNFGTSNFTVECWFNLSTTGTRCIVRPDFTAFELGIDNNNIYVDQTGVTTLIRVSAGTISVNTWNHVAVSRSSTTMRVFFNGSQIGSVTNSTNFASGTGNTRIGGSSFSNSHFFHGYIDDLRVTKVARYTANFTPPGQF